MWVTFSGEELRLLPKTITKLEHLSYLLKIVYLVHQQTHFPNRNICLI